MTYTELDSRLQGRNKASRKLGNNTYAERRGEEAIAVRLHQTDILTFKKDGSVAVSTGGWKTPTTKDRLNTYLPSEFSIYQKNGLWYWRGGIHFAEGDSLAPTGNGGLRLVPQAPLNGEAEEKKLRKRINAFAALAASKVPLPRPGYGDCWHCLLRGPNGKTMGDNFGDTSHLESHMEEGYVVPSLVVQALKEAGNSDFVIEMAFAGVTPKGWGKLAQERVKRAVAKFMRKRFGLA